MKKIYLSLIFSTATLVVVAQGNGKVSGIIKEAESSNPVEFATIAINDPITKKPIDGTIADGKGKFVVKGIANGKYVVAISFIGFETIRREIEITDKNWDIDLGTVLLSFSTEVLEAVTVEGQKSLIEEKVDRMIYNAENDNTAKGGDASDVLKRVPLLTVDLDGNVSIRGSQNIRVLINNRPSTITAGSVADALKQIPADEIKSVEVITSPSSKYDAEGTTGIINIITKKNVLEGATLNVNGSVGNRGSNLGLRGGYKQGKLGLSVGGWGRFGYNTLGSFENTQITTTQTSIQNADTRSNNLRANYSFGIDYDFNPKNFITSSIRLGARGGKDYQDDLSSRIFNNSDNNLIRQSNQNVVTNNKSNSIDMNLNFTHLYNKKDRELSILGLYSIDDGINDFENITFDPIDLTTVSRRKNNNDSYNEEFALQIDYQTPISDNQLFEAGGKQTRRKALSDYAYFSALGTNAYEPIVNAQLSNVFNYIQNVSAGYLSYTLNLKKYAFKAGGRYEYTTIDAFFQDEQDIKIPSYGIFVPSLNLSRKLANNNMLKAAFNRRIQRPSIRYLNPNIQGANPLNVTVGNPSLDPEFTNNFELSYSTYMKGLGLNFTGFARNSNNSIQRVSEAQYVSADTTIIKNSYRNIGIENSYGLSTNINLSIGDKLTFNGGPEIYYATLTNNVSDEKYKASNEGWVISGRLFGSYNITKEWSLQFFSFARGRNVQLQGFQGGFGVYSLGLNKNLPNKRGSIGIGAENFFGKTITIRNETVTPDIIQSGTTVRQNLNFKVNINLRFGKIEGSNNSRGSSSRRSRKSISSDDLKSGGDGGGFDAGGQEQGGQPAGGFAGAQGGQRSAAAAVSAINSDPTAVVEAVGRWAYSIESPQGANGGTVKITKEGDAYSGTIINSRMQKETPLKDVRVNGNELSFNYEASFGPTTNTVTVKGVITGDSFAGVMTVGQFGAFPMTAKREP
ncbi:MAG: TonB-dependent receptor [Cyclobacteriaceae bacterium]|nr:TonB-dependent receptor [Cyclobacteriaceae bacterium]